MTPHQTTLAIMAPLFVWSLYRRIKRNIGRQPIRLPRIILSLAIFASLVTFLVVNAQPYPKLIVGLIGGLATGIPLAFLGLQLTRFEFTESGHFYTPNLYLGLGLTSLLAGRIIYRLLVLNSGAPSPGNSQPQFMQSALTLYLFGVTAGYYLAYYGGVLLRRFRHGQSGRL